ncbi:MAG: argininosuccinate lyase [Clostridia bacterium]|nr:argininosuccinate lyase [Clostridia bacterium]
MDKMWAGRFTKPSDKLADDFNSSLPFDRRMYAQDIRGSIAHATMLGAQKIISEADAETIIAGLQGLLRDLDSGALDFDYSCEDIHMFIEQELTKRIGDTGKRLHTARSRNDQVAVDLRMYLRDECEKITLLIKKLIAAVAEQAEAHRQTILPGYTHLQRAQPIVFGHHLTAYGMMLARDLGRIADAVKRMNVSPLGSCALAGTTYPIDRNATAAALGFDKPCINSIDGVSDRDYCVELLCALSLIMTHLSRFSEEIILWSSWEFRFVELDDAYTTGSSIMPQKKNSDMAELVRGKTGRVYGDLMGMLTVLKGLPLAYNKDMQEDKESIFDAVDTVKQCLEIFIPMIRTMNVNKERMYRAAQEGFINATDIADYLVRKGLPFRTAYKIVGQIVGHCIQTNQVPDEMPLEEYHAFSELFESDLYAEISLESCVKKRTSQGAPGAMDEQLNYLKALY